MNEQPVASATDVLRQVRDEVLVAAGLFDLLPTTVDIYPSESTVVARIATERGDVAIKIFDAAEVDAAVARWRQDIAACAAAHGAPVPPPFVTARGENTPSTVSRSRTILVQATEWSAGTPVSVAGMDEELAVVIGRTVGQLSEALADAPQPPDHEPHLWDMRRTATTLAETLGLVEDPEVRITGLRALQVFRSLERDLDCLPRAVIHQDLHDDNLRVERGPGGPKVVGILDFGDAAFAPRVTEVAIAAAYASRLTSDPVSTVMHVLRGWRDVTHAGEEEARLVLPLAAARLATNAAIWGSRSGGDRGAYAAARSTGSLRAAQRLLSAVE